MTALDPFRIDRRWAALLIIAAIARATSYLERPPQPVAEATIFTILPPWGWSIILLIMAVMLTVGAIARLPQILFVASIIGALCYAIFAYTFTAYVAQDDTLGWAGLMPLIITASVHVVLLSRNAPGWPDWLPWPTRGDGGDR